MSDKELPFMNCPSCGSLIPSTAIRCRMCGMDLSKNREVSASSTSESDKARVKQRTTTISQTEIDEFKRAPELLDEIQDEEQEQVAPAKPDLGARNEPPRFKRELEEKGGDRPNFKAGGAGDREPQRDVNRPQREGQLNFRQPRPQSDQGAPRDNRPSDNRNVESRSVDNRNVEQKPQKLVEQRPVGTAVASSGSGAGQHQAHDDYARPVVANRQTNPAANQASSPSPVQSPSHPRSQSEGKDEGRRSDEQQVGSRDTREGGESRVSDNRQAEMKQHTSLAGASIMESQDVASTKQIAPVHVPPTAPTTAKGGLQIIGWFVMFERDQCLSTFEIPSGKFMVTNSRLRDNDLVFPYSSLSTPHAILNSSQGKIMVLDLMSEKGSYVKKKGEKNYIPAVETVALGHGDRVKFGDFEVLVCLIPFD